jgi:CRP-like cAMP-binding protein
MMEVTLFDRLAPEEQDIVAKRIEFMNIRKGSYLFQEGGVGNTLYYLVSGKVEIRKESMDGKQAIMSQFSRGSILGEQALLEAEPRRSATAIAIEDCDLLVLNRDAFEAMVADYPRIGVAILRGIGVMLADRLRSISGRFADILS